MKKRILVLLSILFLLNILYSEDLLLEVMHRIEGYENWYVGWSSYKNGEYVGEEKITMKEYILLPMQEKIRIFSESRVMYKQIDIFKWAMIYIITRDGREGFDELLKVYEKLDLTLPKDENGKTFVPPEGKSPSLVLDENLFDEIPYVMYYYIPLIELSANDIEKIKNTIRSKMKENFIKERYLYIGNESNIINLRILYHLEHGGWNIKFVDDEVIVNYYKDEFQKYIDDAKELLNVEK